MYHPNKKLAASAHIKGIEAYEKLYKKSISNPELFWSQQAKEHISWFKPWDFVVEYDVSHIGENQKPYVKFFSGAKLNVAYNCIDRHLNSCRRNKAAIIWQGEKESEKITLFSVIT